MLNFLRSIFGCYSNDYVVTLNLDEQENEHTVILTKTPDDEKQEKDLIISNIVEAVIDEKSKHFVSYVEDAMDSVTDYKFNKFVNN